MTRVFWIEGAVVVAPGVVDVGWVVVGAVVVGPVVVGAEVVGCVVVGAGVPQPTKIKPITIRIKRGMRNNFFIFISFFLILDNHLINHLACIRSHVIVTSSHLHLKQL
jgi:hypothetical protein